MSRSPWDHEPVDDPRIDLLMPAPATGPHDGGALFPDDFDDHKSGHATAYVSRQYVGSDGRAGNGIVAATSVRADERVHYPPRTLPYLADHPADAMHLPLPSGPTPCHPPLPRCRAPENCPLPPADMAGVVRCTGCARLDRARLQTRQARTGPGRLPGPLRPSDPTPLTLVDVPFGFCRRQLPTNEPPVVSDLARAGAISLPP
ncbi:transposase [Streptomyces sporangiiformans]|uniref:Transposase n=1 Tax=Streptomyces sporangiiformans TaxID=2315329 RepID=A0A505DFC1_9ACTN|nr:transposase [Streptomyces sporangiiformans]